MPSHLHHRPITTVEAVLSPSYPQVVLARQQFHRQMSVAITVTPAPSTDHKSRTVEDRQQQPASTLDSVQIPALTTAVSRRDEISAL